MADNKFKDILENLLKKDSRLIDENKELNLSVLRELADKTDDKLIELLLSKEEVKNKFFLRKKDVLIFKQNDLKFYLDENKIDNTYTIYENKIGLSNSGRLLKDIDDVVLNFPYKDCVLEGGQSTEEGIDEYYEYNKESNEYITKKSLRKEVYFNEILAKDEIDRLFEPKAFVNIKKFSHKEKGIIKEFCRDDKNIISDNLIIKGNNLLVLHSLKHIFSEQIKLIYIDPPYNTGNDSFRYNDKFNHSSWLLFLKNRLEIAKELLTPDGSIFISIDQNEIGYLLILLDEIFGKENCKNIITIKRSSVSGAKVINPGVVNVSEFLVIYSKNTNIWKPIKAFKEKEWDKRYNNFIINKESNPAKWKYTTILEAFADKVGIKKSKLKKHFGERYEEALNNFVFTNSDKVIQFAYLDDNSISEAAVEMKSKSQQDESKTYILKREGKANYYMFGGKVILFFQDRLINIGDKNVFGEMVSDIWDDVLPNDIHNEGGVKLRKGKKPEKLISRILEIGSSENDIVLDFFVGSGTTACVSHKMKRRYIGIEQLDYVEELPLKRLINTINGEQSGISKDINWKGGGSFVYMELKKWNEQAKEEIDKCNTLEELKKLLNILSDKYFLNYNVKFKEFQEKIIKEKSFTDLPLKKQKEMFAKMLDLNQLYINVSEMEDKKFAISKEDIALTKNFYNL